MIDGPALGSRIRSMREKCRFTIRELSRRSGASESYISRIEDGSCIPSIPCLERLTRACQGDIHTLLDGIGDATNDPRLFNLSTCPVVALAASEIKKMSPHFRQVLLEVVMEHGSPVKPIAGKSKEKKP